MKIELLIGGSFIFIILIEAVILLNSFFHQRPNLKKDFNNLFFRFISNSFIYIVALLILSNPSTLQKELFGLINWQNLNLIQIAVLTILFTDLISFLIIIITFITKFSNKKEESSSKIINQNKAKKIT